MAGLIGLIVSVGGQYAVLTANAFNAWALVGPTPLASLGVGSQGSWTADSLVVFGIPAVTLGAIVLAGVGLLAVTKSHPVAAVEYAARYGLPAVGENRVQEAESKIPGFAATPALR